MDEAVDGQGPQGLKPACFSALCGTAEAAALPKEPVHELASG